MSAATAAPATGQDQAVRSPWMIGILLAMANFLAVLDVTIANVSVPTIAGNLGATPSQGTWVITSYAVAEAIMVPLTGWLAARFGSVRVFVAAMIGFTGFSALCGLAQNLEMLVLFRVLQGFCGGPLMPLSQTLLLRVFPPKSQPAAMGLWAMTTLIAPIAGPVLGGLLCDNFGWPSIFWVNVPVAMVCVPMLIFALRRYETETVKARVDGVGLGLLVLWVGALQLMLDLGKEHDWFESGLITGLGIVALIGFVAFLIWELTEKEPIVALRVFRHRGFAMSCITLALAFGSFMAINVLVPQWLQLHMGYTATWAGYVSGMIGMLALVSAPIVAKLSSRGIDPRILIFAGVMWLAAVTWIRADAITEMSFWQIAIWPLVMGFGVPLFFIPLNMVGLGAVDPEETASAAGLINFIRTIAGAFATSLVNTVWEHGAARNQAELAGVLHDPEGAVAAMQGAGFTHDQAVAALANTVSSQAVMIGTNEVMALCAFGFGIAAMSIWLAPRPRPGVDMSGVH
ncbi:DHA2 family efflux MFS transporter permease subunit [Sphingomonas canadensis]|uniref:DHA2 family efflux MFS transporter permease subunit n=1 Tax=Sphingomonas canadensis TaxID=1219257 RepID=A0ABW3H726_9SPHN|nr:DHA2 family efflux MFS transporter permease subunit [Sphingomonas canadensis]MCW3834664.1 DHA2 family efflux MFS transporter permease subunit [Sphingomonas canadensis]